MARDHFIIFVYCLICEHFDKSVGGQRLRKRGFALALSKVFSWQTKGSLTSFDNKNWPGKRGLNWSTPSRKNMQVPLPAPVRRISKRWRKLVETVASHLIERYRIAHTRARDLWHYQNQLNRKVLSHTICVLINLQLGRPPLHLDDLVIN